MKTIKLHPSSTRSRTASFVFGTILIFSLTLFAFVYIPTANAQETETVTLEVGSFVPPGFSASHSLDQLPEVLDEQAPGMFTVEYRGGPETFPGDELFGYVQRDAIDIANIVGPLYVGEEFLAQAENLADPPVWDLRRIGVHEWLDEVHRPHGVKYLGRAMSGTPFHCYTQERVESPEDLEGMQLRGSPVYRPWIEHFGAEIIIIPLPEVYTALERGVVDGFCVPSGAQVVNQEWYEHVNYIIEPGVWQVEVSFIMNLDAWEGLSSKHQNALIEAIRTLEDRNHYYFAKRNLEHRIFLLEQGLEVIEFEGEARERWVSAAYREFWKYLFENSNRHDKIYELNRILQDAGQQTYFPAEYEE